MLNNCPLLTILIFLPLAGCLLLLPFWNRAAVARSVAFGVAAIELTLTGWLYAGWRGLERVPTKLPGYLLVEDFSGIPAVILPEFINNIKARIGRAIVKNNYINSLGKIMRKIMRDNLRSGFYNNAQSSQR